MAYQIKVSKRFRSKALKIYIWLADKWNFSVADEYYDKVEKKLHLLETQPLVGRPSGRKPEIRRTTITKHTILYYRIRKIG